MERFNKIALGLASPENRSAGSGQPGPGGGIGNASSGNRDCRRAAPAPGSWAAGAIRGGVGRIRRRDVIALLRFDDTKQVVESFVTRILFSSLGKLEVRFLQIVFVYQLLNLQNSLLSLTRSVLPGISKT